MFVINAKIFASAEWECNQNKKNLYLQKNAFNDKYKIWDGIATFYFKIINLLIKNISLNYKNCFSFLENKKIFIFRYKNY